MVHGSKIQFWWTSEEKQAAEGGNGWRGRSREDEEEGRNSRVRGWMKEIMWSTHTMGYDTASERKFGHKLQHR